ncbi:hypothetical protein COCON_G00123840 [Conger conger]|uniref:Uncharacterized protein n=1 Tax=Conger conger TaxID=82655 RepID=A0A9Q1DHA2_CONCO|nr:hypothetical protein COCON_G00123840 [Conger conger]
MTGRSAPGRTGFCGWEDYSLRCCWGRRQQQSQDPLQLEKTRNEKGGGSSFVSVLPTPASEATARAWESSDRIRLGAGGREHRRHAAWKGVSRRGAGKHPILFTWWGKISIPRCLWIESQSERSHRDRTTAGEDRGPTQLSEGRGGCAAGSSSCPD